MLSGFASLSATFFSDVLSRKHKQPVRVWVVHLADCTDLPGRRGGAARGLKKVDLETSEGPLRLLVKLLSQARSREALVWRFLQQAGGMPLPEVYHIEYSQRTGQYGVIMEYIAPPPEGQGWDETQSRHVGAMVARLHGRYWGRAHELPESIPAPQTAPSATVEPGVRRFFDRMSPRQQEALSAAVPAVLGFLTGLLRMPPAFFEPPDDELDETLIHGSLDTSEVLFRPTGRLPPPVLIDWEHARRGRGCEDIAGLVNGLSAERAAGREALVAGYLDALHTQKVVVAPEQFARHLARQRVLLAGRNLPRLCEQYVDRKDDPGYQQWCKWFLDVACKDVAELKKLLGRQADDLSIPERT